MIAGIFNKLISALILVIFAYYYQSLVVPVAGTHIPSACSFNWSTMTNGNWTSLTNGQWTALCN